MESRSKERGKMFLDYVNIEVGTDSVYRQSKGNTLPIVTTPFGMQGFVMQTDQSAGGWFYRPSAKYTEGIRVSNQPSPWLGDYGHIVFMPQSKTHYIDEGGRHSSISDKKLAPNFMSMYLNRYGVKVDLTPSERGAKVQMSYDFSDEKKLLLVKTFKGQSSIEVLKDELRICTKACSKNKYSKEFKKFYIFKFDKRIINHEFYDENRKVVENFGENMSVVLEFSSEKVDFDLVSSYISFEQANLNLEKELKEKSFLDLKEETAEKWEKHLQTIEITGTREEKRVFYSNLYRCFLFPRVSHEYNEENEAMHRSFYTNKVEKGVMYTDNGFWDTYRTTFPLFSILIPDRYKEIVKAILNVYKESGWLPRWLSPYERGIMPSTLTDSVIAEAIIKDFVEPEDLDIALEALQKDANEKSNDDLNGRKLIKEYIEFGYIPYDMSHESVSMTLDNSYSDYCIGKALEKSGHLEKAKEYFARSKNYLNLFNSESKFFESKDSKGIFNKNFNPNDWGYDYCESSAWQNNFSVVHDIKNFIKKFGLVEAQKRVSEIFTLKPRYNVGRYNFEIHEMTEMAIIDDLGHFAISNQPSFYLPYTYFALDQAEKTYEILKKAHKYFTDKADGYPGDEDNGSLAAWYVFTTIGLYPYCPVDAEYYQTPTTVESVVIKTNNNSVHKNKNDEYKIISHFDLLR